MRSTRLQINAIIGLGIMAVLAIGLLYILIHENGAIDDTRFLHIAGLIAAIVWGIRGIVERFAGVPDNCPHCGEIIANEMAQGKRTKASRLRPSHDEGSDAA